MQYYVWKDVQNDAKQPCLQFNNPKTDFNCNITRGEQDNTEGVDNLIYSDEEESNMRDKNGEEAQVNLSDTEQDDDLGNKSDQGALSFSQEESNSPDVEAQIEVPRQPILGDYNPKTFGD